MLQGNEQAQIRYATPDDAEAICRIYNHYVTNTIVTFEEEAVTAEEMQDRIRDIQAKFPWLVCEENGEVTGYAYAGPWKSRCAYRYSAEATVYLAPGYTGKGTGSRLYTRLLEEVRGLDMHSIIGGIALPNIASVALHERMGFIKVAHFKEVGFKFDKWIDVGYWELILS